MPQLDFYHGVVRRVLEKAGWRIIEETARIDIEEEDLWVYIDFIAENITASEHGRFPIAVAIEVKSFENPSPMNEFQKGLGQYLLYAAILEEMDYRYDLYLGIPLKAYDTFFQKSVIRKLVQKHGVNLLVFDPDNEEVISWIS